MRDPLRNDQPAIFLTTKISNDMTKTEIPKFVYLRFVETRRRDELIEKFDELVTEETDEEDITKIENSEQYKRLMRELIISLKKIKLYNQLIGD